MYVLFCVWMLVLINYLLLFKGYMFWIIGCGLYELGSYVCEFFYYSLVFMLLFCWCLRVCFEYFYVEGCKIFYYLIIGIL